MTRPLSSPTAAATTIIAAAIVVVLLLPRQAAAADPCATNNGCDQPKDMSKVKVTWVPQKTAGKPQQITADTTATGTAYTQLEACFKQLPCAVTDSVREIYLVDGNGALTSHNLDQHMSDIAMSNGKPDEVGYALPGGYMVLDLKQIPNKVQQFCAHEAPHLQHYNIDSGTSFNLQAYLANRTQGEADRSAFVNQVMAAETDFSGDWLKALQAVGNWNGYAYYRTAAYNPSEAWKTPWFGFVRPYSTNSLPDDIATTVEDLLSGCKGVQTIANLDHTKEPKISDPGVQVQAQRRMGAKLKLLLDNGFICQSHLDTCGVDVTCDSKGDCRVGPKFTCGPYTAAIKLDSTSSGLTEAAVNKQKNSAGGQLGGMLKSGAVTTGQVKSQCGIDTDLFTRIWSTMGGPKSCCEEGWWQGANYCGNANGGVKAQGYTFSMAGVSGCIDSYHSGI